MVKRFVEENLVRRIVADLHAAKPFEIDGLILTRDGVMAKDQVSDPVNARM